MKVVITGRHLDLGDDIRSYVDKKLHKAETYFDRIVEAHMVLTAERHRRIAEVTLTAKRVVFHAREETENIYASIDGVIEKVDKQIRKYKERIKDRKHQVKELAPIVEEDSEANAKEPQIIKVHRFAPKPITVQEAVMQMLTSEEDFIMFSNSVTDQVNVVYKRKDGNYGWIEPDFE